MVIGFTSTYKIITKVVSLIPFCGRSNSSFVWV